MELPSLTTVSDRLISRGEAIAYKFSCGLTPVSKELRQFPVKFFPSVIAQLREHFDEVVYTCRQSTTSYGFTPMVEGPTIQDVLNLAFSGSFYYLDDKRLANYPEPVSVKIKITKKLRVPSSELNLSEWCTRTARDHYSTYQRFITLSELLKRHPDESISTFVPVKFLSDLSHVITSDPSSSWAEQRQLLAEFRQIYNERLTLLELNVRTYVSRGDMRAYVYCKNYVSHIVGACLQGLLVPKSKSIYARTQYGKMIDRVGKNFISFYVERRPHESLVQAVVLDISSFTSSNVNATAMPLAMLVALKTTMKENNINKTIHFNLNGEYICATLSDVLELYIYYTALGDLYVRETNEITYVIGGYLGVPANMALSMLVLLVVIKFTERAARSYGVRILFKPGGDDVFVLIMGNEVANGIVLRILEKNLIEYVGFLKEFTVTEVALDRVFVGDFCKKRVIAVPAGNRIDFRSEIHLPIPTTLLDPLNRRSYFKEMKKVYDSAMVELSGNCDVEVVRICCEAYLQAFEGIHGRKSGQLMERRFSIKEDPDLELLYSGDRKFTREAWDAIITIPAAPSPLSPTFRTTTIAKLVYALDSDLIRVKKIGNLLVYFRSVEEKAIFSATFKPVSRLYNELVEIPLAAIRTTIDIFKTLN